MSGGSRCSIGSIGLCAGVSAQGENSTNTKTGNFFLELRNGTVLVVWQSLVGSLSGIETKIWNSTFHPSIDRGKRKSVKRQEDPNGNLQSVRCIQMWLAMRTQKNTLYMHAGCWSEYCSYLRTCLTLFFVCSLFPSIAHIHTMMARHCFHGLCVSPSFPCIIVCIALIYVLLLRTGSDLCFICRSLRRYPQKCRRLCHS